MWVSTARVLVQKKAQVCLLLNSGSALLASSEVGGRSQGGVEGSGDASSAAVTIPSAHSTETQWVVSLPTLLLLWIREKQIVRVAPDATSWMADGRRPAWRIAG